MLSCEVADGIVFRQDGANDQQIRGVRQGHALRRIIVLSCRLKKITEKRSDTSKGGS